MSGDALRVADTVTPLDWRAQEPRVPTEGSLEGGSGLELSSAVRRVIGTTLLHHGRLVVSVEFNEVRVEALEDAARERVAGDVHQNAHPVEGAGRCPRAGATWRSGGRPR